jgi:hypothetical protein
MKAIISGIHMVQFEKIRIFSNMPMNCFERTPDAIHHLRGVMSDFPELDPGESAT